MDFVLLVRKGVSELSNREITEALGKSYGVVTVAWRTLPDPVNQRLPAGDKSAAGTTLPLHTNMLAIRN